MAFLYAKESRGEGNTSAFFIPVKLGGKMSEKAADKVGNKLANAALIITTCWGISAIIFAVAYFVK